MISVAALSTATSTPTQLLLQSSTRTHLHSALFLFLSHTRPLLSGSDWECVRAFVTCLPLRLLHTLHSIIIIIICHFVAFINWPGVKSATLTPTPTSATWHGSFCYCYQKTHTHTLKRSLIAPRSLSSARSLSFYLSLLLIYTHLLLLPLVVFTVFKWRSYPALAFALPAW